MYAHFVMKLSRHQLSPNRQGANEREAMRTPRMSFARLKRGTRQRRHK